VKAVAEEETGLVTEGGGEDIVKAPSEETVAVPVSPSDLLLMYFKVLPFLSNFTYCVLILLLFCDY